MKYPLIGLLLALISTSALAGVKKPPPPPPEPPPVTISDADATAGAHAGAEADAAADANSNATGGQANATGGAADATGGASNATGGNATGASSTTSYNSSFFALSRSQPGASGCWGGADGGGAGSSGGGFLGIHILNNECWASYLAEMERSVMIKARLNCGGKQYRNAVAFDSPRKTRQADCIAIVTDEYNRQIEHDDAIAQSLLLLQEIDRLEQTLLEVTTDLDTTIEKLTTCRIGNERATEAYLGCLKK